MPGLALRRLRLLPLWQWPAHKFRHRLSRLGVRFGITTDPLCIWSQTAHRASFIIKSLDQECWMREHVLGRFYSAAMSNGGEYSGTAYFFNPHCGPIPFEVKGPSLEDEERIVLTGQAPRVGGNCRTYGSYTSNLEFRRSKSDEANQTQAKTATVAPAIGASRTEIKPDVSSTNGGEVPRAPTGQRATRNETPSMPKDSSASLVDSKGPGTSTGRTSVPDESPGPKDLDKYLWGAAFIVMIVWLLIKLFGKILIGIK